MNAHNIIPDGHPVCRYRARLADFYAVPILAAPTEIRDHMRATWAPLLGAVRGRATDNVCIAGGAVRDARIGVAPKDIDVFFASEEDMKRGVERLVALGSTDDDEWAIGHRMTTPWGRVDLINAGGGIPLETIVGFDFVAICMAVSLSTFAYHCDAASQARARSLTINACPRAVHTFSRAQRFIKLGWTMDPAELAILEAEAERRPATDPMSSGPDSTDTQPEPGDGPDGF